MLAKVVINLDFTFFFNLSGHRQKKKKHKQGRYRNKVKYETGRKEQGKDKKKIKYPVTLLWIF